jgi:hypothetical protein
MTVKDNRSAAHTENHTEAINKDIEAHIDHQDRTTSHDNNHNNPLSDPDLHHILFYSVHIVHI